MYEFSKLKQNYEFRRAYGRGQSFVCPYFVLYAVKGKKDSVRLGLTVSKKLGTAVQRNRAKRLMTVAFCQNFAALKKGYDYVLVARTRILKTKSGAVSAALKKILEENEL